MGSSTGLRRAVGGITLKILVVSRSYVILPAKKPRDADEAFLAAFFSGCLAREPLKRPCRPMSNKTICARRQSTTNLKYHPEEHRTERESATSHTTKLMQW